MLYQISHITSDKLLRATHLTNYKLITVSNITNYKFQTVAKRELTFGAQKSFSDFLKISMAEEELTPISKEPKSPQKKTHRGKKKQNMVIVDGPTIIMDLQWDYLMSEHTQKKLIPQLSMSYSTSKMAKKSVPMLFTSLNNKWIPNLEKVNFRNWNSKIVTMEEKPFIDCVDHDKIVYLTADTDNVCMELDPSKYYVIGCLIDHNSKKNATRDYAIQHNLRMERLPIPEFIEMEGRHVLTVNQVAEILIRVINGENWGDAFCHVIPARKKPTSLITQKETEKSHSFCRI